MLCVDCVFIVQVFHLHRHHPQQIILSSAASESACAQPAPQPAPRSAQICAISSSVSRCHAATECARAPGAHGRSQSESVPASSAASA